MKSPLQWKAFYAAERRRLGEAGLCALLDRAPTVELPTRGTLIIPHTRLTLSGELIAAAALAVVDSGVEEVLALGVLHGARELDAEQVARARAGDAAALASLRRVHGPGAPADAGHWTEEFSLDAFCELVELAARRANRRPPRIIQRYPFLTGAQPESLPGLDELRALIERGLPIVATTDPLHHGIGYGTPTESLRARLDPATHAWAEQTIFEGLTLLADRQFDAFLQQAASVRSDFRDSGPVLRAIVDGDLRPQVHALTLVNYADVFGMDEPTWVAAALAEFR